MRDTKGEVGLGDCEHIIPGVDKFLYSPGRLKIKTIDIEGTNLECLGLSPESPP